MKLYPEDLFDTESNVNEDYYFIDSLTYEKVLYETSFRMCKEENCFHASSKNGCCEHHNRKNNPREDDYRNKLLQSGKPVQCTNYDGKLFGFDCCKGIWIATSSLDVDHIDNNHDNNRLDNLQWLCKMSHHIKGEIDKILVDTETRIRSKNVYNKLIQDRVSSLLQRENYPDWEANIESIMGYVFRQSERICSKQFTE